MQQFPHRLLLLAGFPLLLTLAGGCYSGLQAGAGPQTVVGEAPLRRLTNEEYLNALQDLFPGVVSSLPPLPSDALVNGFENDATAQAPSDVRISRYQAIADQVAAAATQNTDSVRKLVGCTDWSTPELQDACALRFVHAEGARLFRRPLLPEEQDRLLHRFVSWSNAVDFEGAVRLSLAAMLQSPQFLYRIEVPPSDATGGAVVTVDPYSMATRLSFFLWSSVPDETLLRAAAENHLSTESEIRSQAERMLKDARAKRLYWSFYRQWLGLDRVIASEHSIRTANVDPQWRAQSQSSAMRESQRFVEHLTDEGGSMADLLTSPKAWLDPEMARIYGVPMPSSELGAAVELPLGERSGLLTRAAFLAGYSHPGATSPPIRGNAVLLRLLCEFPLSPPPGANVAMPVALPGEGPKTNRTLFEERTRAPACMSCHESLNGFGFGFEQFNAAGAFQRSDNGLAVNARGSIVGTDVDTEFEGAVELSQHLARSKRMHECASQQWLRYALGRAPQTSEAPLVRELTAASMLPNSSIKGLLLNIVGSQSFRSYRKEAQP